MTLAREMMKDRLMSEEIEEREEQRMGSRERGQKTADLTGGSR